MQAPKISAAALTEVETALKQYVREVLDATLSNWAQLQYVDNADRFVRWLKNDFTPGARNAPFPKVKFSEEKKQD